jgi:hypothetical protein
MATELTERTVIEKAAVELGWSIRQGGDWTAFGYNGSQLTVWWRADSTAGSADMGEPGDLPDFTVLSNVAEWVQQQLEAVREGLA